MGTPLYDEFSADYDRFVNWPSRLAYEMGFIEAQLKAVKARRVLDTACGTGMHAIALAQRGYETEGADISTAMIERAQANAAAAGVSVRFWVAGFGQMASQITEPFDALLCLGNSLPHVLTPAALADTLADFAACLRSNGLLLIQNRNFDLVLAQRQRWMPPEAHHEGDRQWLFIRFYDFDPDGLLTFNVMTLRREASGTWQQRVTATRLWPQLQSELLSALEAAGFRDVQCYGDMQGAPFVPTASGNLVIVAHAS